MIKSFSTYFFAIMLALTGTTFYANNTQDPESYMVSQEEIDLYRQNMEELRAQTQHHTGKIGHSVQQILLYLSNKDSKGTAEQKTHAKKEFEKIQSFVENMQELMSKMSQVQEEILFELTKTNYTIIKYLLPIVKNNIFDVSITELEEASKTVTNNIIKQAENGTSFEEIMDSMIESVEKNTLELEKACENIHLTWYNHIYRALPKNKIAFATKTIGVSVATIAIASYFASILVNDLPESVTDKSWFKNYIAIPYLQDSRGNIYDPSSQDTVLRSTLPLVQKICFAGDTIQKRTGLFTVTGSLVAFSQKDIFSALYKDPWFWLKDTTAKGLKKIDHKLQGKNKKIPEAHSCEKVYFKDMTGAENLEKIAKKIAHFMKHPHQYELAQIEEHRGILLYGPPQTGKTLFAKALRTLIEDQFGDDKKVHFLDAKRMIDIGWSIEDIFGYAEYLSPCIIFFDEIDMVGAHREKNTHTTSQLLTCMQGIDMTSKQVIVIGATNKPESLDQALLVDGRFGKIIHVDYPKYEERKSNLKYELAKRSINLNPEFIDYMAQETEGCSYNNLKRIITEAIIRSSLEVRPVNEQDFEQTLDYEVRHIQDVSHMADLDKEIISIYQAGKALARHLLQTTKEVVKVTILPVAKNIKVNEFGHVVKTDTQTKPENEKLVANSQDSKIKLGEVFTKTSLNHNNLVSDSKLIAECLALLAGQAALKIITGQKYTDCNPQDRAEAMNIIYKVVGQGEKISKEIQQKALELKDQYEEEITALLSKNKKQLEEIIAILKDQLTIDRYEWEKLKNNF